VIREELPNTHVVMFTSFGGQESVLASMMAGATGFLTKSVSHVRLVEAIRSAAHGESLLDPSITHHLIGRLTSLSNADSALLSPREADVLRLVAQGLTNKEIAARLFLSPFTVRNQVIRILEKLGMTRRAEAAAAAVRMGLLQ
jgi:DNA-binding NarL/FixJ family response regulator